MSRSVIMLGILVIAVAIIWVFLFQKNKGEMKTEGGTVPSKEALEGNYHDWHVFEAPSGNFSVMVPTLPQHATEKLVDPESKESRKYDMYVSERPDGSVFMINTITFPEGNVTKIDDQIAQSVVSDMLASNPQNKLNSMQLVDYNNTKALDFSIKNDQYYIDGKVFLIDQTLYVLAFLAKHDSYNPKEFDFFAKSFKLAAKNQMSSEKQ